MIDCSIRVETQGGVCADFKVAAWGRAHRDSRNDITVNVGDRFPYEVTVIPPVGDIIKKIIYTIATNLKNYYQVIVPDTGREYIGEKQLILYWYKKYLIRANNIRMPINILMGMDHYSRYVLGIIGENYETDFHVKEPSRHRALVAWMKRLTIEISRGTDEYPIPDFVARAHPDGSITERMFIQMEDDVPAGETWLDTLNRFSRHVMDLYDVGARSTCASLDPYWCSWTDWFSEDVTEKVILDNVREGLKLGIKNYIIDDGWFGPGLDTEPDVPLNIGDWQEDPNKIPDLKALVDKVKGMGARPIIWCAPHAVAPQSNAYAKHAPLLIRLQSGQLMTTINQFHALCFRCPQAREVMAELCVDLIRRYGFDGAKYDLYNCLPNDNCCSTEHEHDTVSMIEGLHKTMALIDHRTRELKDDYIVELKQNYGTPFLIPYGTILRAGDTPYDPEGNFIRAAYLTGYTPYVLNDYQTLTNSDSPAECAATIIKMLAVGVPSYSCDFAALNDEVKNTIAYFHQWYDANKPILTSWRRPVDPDLNVWHVPGEHKDIYFCINFESRVSLQAIKTAEIINGTFCPIHYIELPETASGTITVTEFATRAAKKTEFAKVDFLKLNLQPGDIVTVEFS